MQMPLPLTRDLVLIGGGHTHALVLRMWGMAPLPGVRVTLINPGPKATYSGMLPGLIAGHYTRPELEIDLVRLARFGGARLVVGTATGIDRQARLIEIEGHPDVHYDIASIDIGIHTGMPALPGFSESGIAAKPLDAFAASWESWIEGVAAGATEPRSCVIGAGLAGAELVLAMDHRLRALGAEPSLSLIDSREALAAVTARTRALLLDRLAAAGVALRQNVRATGVTASGVRLEDGSEIASTFTVGVAGAQPHRWLSGLGLETRDGYICVDDDLRSEDDDRIFAAGDCAHLAFAPRPKAGVFAVRAAPLLHANLRAALAGTRPRRFRPQKDYLKLIALGGREAIADRSGMTLSGRWVWAWKDRIDRRFMAKFQQLPEMPAPALPTPRALGIEQVLGEKPLCGGCGAKVAGGRLKAALSHLPAPRRPDVLTLPGDDAAILSLGGTRQVLTTDHLRAFTDDPVTLARITAIHALGDIWAMAARPQAALASITLPRMSDEMQANTLREILDAASAVLRAEGAELVGGHTSVGAELTIGFTITGLVGAAPVALAGARPGDALILTRPIGSGTILAAEMQRKADGADVLAALGAMARPQGKAADILRHAHAMTDVTGFGLAGHLMGICEASEVGAELVLADIPLYRGAEALARAGVRSTLYPANREISAAMVVPEDPRAALLFDPQTAGGLLAAVPPDAAEEILECLAGEGVPAARIGRITEGPPFITIT